jgi:hypothetical protein
MIRAAWPLLALLACGRSQGVPDQDLGGLVIAPRPNETPIDLDRASREPAELGRALAQPSHVSAAALGPYTVTIATSTKVTEDGKPVSELADSTLLELGDKGTYHAVYTNSADYGREVTWTSGKLFLRPRYQRWHARAPESPDEPDKLRDEFANAIPATWDLLAPAVELSDLGPAQVSGRVGRKIAIKLSPDPKKPPAESLVQRKWREQRTIPELYGEVVLDADKGVPLAVKLAGTVEFTRDGRQFVMKVTLDATFSGIGRAVAIATPPEGEVVATPERMREVDDRDFLLQGIAPPLRKNSDGTPRVTDPAGAPRSGATAVAPQTGGKK